MIYHFGPYAFNPQTRDLTCGETRVKLQPKSLQVLQYLLDRPGGIVTREQLLHALWPDDPVHENNLTQHIFLLRQAFAHHTPALTVLLTISGSGYRVSVPVEIFSSVNLLRSPAWRWYARGKFLLSKRCPKSFREALESFQRAVSEDPSLADAYAGIAEARVALAVSYESAASSEFPRAAQAATKALTLDPEHAEAYRSLGDVAFLYGYDAQRAREYYDRSLFYAPHGPRALVAKGLTYASSSATEQARQEVERAVQLDPVSLELLTMYGAVDFYAGDRQKARARLEDVLQIDESFEPAAAFLATCLALLGAAEEVRALRTRFNGGAYCDRLEAAQGVADAVAGDAVNSRAALGRVRSRTLQAGIFAAMGLANEALRVLSSALAEREPDLAFLHVDPFLKPLHGQRGFELLGKELASAGVRLPDDRVALLAGRSGQ